ncbi:MAG: aldehyde dehydrogenase family protein, partial [Saprospiraceae bacterium]
MAIDTRFLPKLGVKKFNNGTITGLKSSNNKNYTPSLSPVDGNLIGAVSNTTPKEYEKVIKTAQKAFETWKMMPAPKRGEIVRQYGECLRKHKDALGRLVSYEMGKSLQEGWGEVQEMIDICDFAVGLSRQLYGLTMHSERSMHRMYEQWHPLGIVGVISAFNFPVAVWSWNAMLALVCGDVVVWKPSEKTPLCGVACMNIFNEVLQANHLPEGIVSMINGDYRVGEFMTNDTRIPLISATGSTRMGKIVGSAVAARLGRTLLELGGNNAIIVTPKADLGMVLTGAVFGAVGTAGQRCTTTRRLIIHQSIFDKVTSSIIKAYKQIKIGNPLDPSVHMGPLIDLQAVFHYQKALEAIEQQGGRMLVKGGVLKGKKYASGCYVMPCIAEVKNDLPI